VRLRIATAAAVVAGIAVGLARSRGTRLRVVADDGTTVPARVPQSRRTGKVRAVLVLATIRIRDAVGVRLGWRDGEAATEALIVEMTGELASAINGHSSLAG
jgi:hypothetical protein